MPLDPPSKGELFCRIPDSVLLDKTLRFADFRVYCHMSRLCRKTNILHVGQRQLAQATGMSRRSLCRSLERLGKSGHVSRSIHTLSHRTVYCLNSPIFLATVELPPPPSYRPRPPKTVLN